MIAIIEIRQDLKKQLNVDLDLCQQKEPIYLSTVMIVFMHSNISCIYIIYVSNLIYHCIDLNPYIWKDVCLVFDTRVYHFKT